MTKIKPLIQLREMIAAALSSMTNLSKTFEKFIIDTMQLFLTSSRRMNFTQMARCSSSCESRFSQNFNRYSYALNNPLKYTDENGEWLVITAIFRFPILLYKGIIQPVISGNTDINIIKQKYSDEWLEYKRIVSNAKTIDSGLFYSDSNRTPEERKKELKSRFFAEWKQTWIGFFVAGTYNLMGDVNEVSQYGGATVIESKRSDWGDVTLGCFIIGQKGIEADPSNKDFQHEYGHYLQSQESGIAYFERYGLPSLWSDHDHNNHPVEQDANIRAYKYFSKYVKGFNKIDSSGKYDGLWVASYNPINGFVWDDLSNKNNILILNNTVKPDGLDYLASLFPVVGDIIGGYLRSITDNTKY